MKYTLTYKVREERMHRIPLPDMTEEQALKQFDAEKQRLLLLGDSAVYIRLFVEKNTVPCREVLFGSRAQSLLRTGK